jgi:hypothetical protein
MDSLLLIVAGGAVVYLTYALVEKLESVSVRVDFSKKNIARSSGHREFGISRQPAILRSPDEHQSVTRTSRRGFRRRNR